MKLMTSYSKCLFLVCLLATTACSGEGKLQQSVNDLLHCSVDENNAYSQSEMITCVDSFTVGDDRFQSGDIAKSVRFSNDSSHIYTLSSHVQTWNLVEGNEVEPCNGDACYDEYLSDYARIHIDDSDNYIGFTSHGRVYNGFTSAANPLYESPLFANGGLETAVYIDDLDQFIFYNSAKMAFFDRGTNQVVFDLEFAPLEIEEVAGGKNGYAVSFSNANRVFLFFTDESREEITLETNAPIIQMHYSPDASLLATFDQNGELTVWASSDGSQMFRQQIEIDQFFADVLGDEYKPSIDWSISPDNQILVATGDESGKVVTFWSLDNGEIIAEFETTRLPSDITIAPNGNLLAITTSTAGQYDANIIECNGRNESTCDYNGGLKNGQLIVYDISELMP